MSQYLDKTGLQYFWQKIVSKFVAKESGKGLSTNDFTTELKNKLDGIAANANNYTLPTASSTTLGGIKVGSGLSISNGVLSASGGVKVQRITIDFSDVVEELTISFPFSIKCMLIVYDDGSSFSSVGSLHVHLPGDTFTAEVYNGSTSNDVECTISSNGNSLKLVNTGYRSLMEQTEAVLIA